MRAVILAGGLGTRLREETEFRPKPMVEVGHKPILWHIMKIFSHYGVRDFVICAGYRGEMIKEYFLNYEAWNNDFTLSLGGSHDIVFHGKHTESDWRVTVADTGEDTQTGGRVQLIQRYVEGERFMVTYGDGLADVDISDLLAYHDDHGKAATMTTVRPSSRFGVVDVDDDGSIRHFREKPRGEDWVNAGFFVFDPPVFDYLDDGPLEQAPLQALAKDGELRAYRHEGYFQCMDTYREARLLNDQWQGGVAPWKVWPG